MRQKLANLGILLLAFYFLNIISITNQFFLSPIVALGKTTTIKIYPGETVSTVAARLAQKQMIKYPVLFEQFAFLTTSRGHLRYGEYQIRYPMTTWQLLRNMKNGTGLVKYRFTIVNGWTFDNIRAALLQEDNVKHSIRALSNATVMQDLHSTHLQSEGLFYPDTYFFTWGNTDLSVLKTAHQKMQTVLTDAWKQRAPDLPYQNAYQALIIASLIERETSVDAEKPLIASVMLNRLKKNMPLQIDPTVLYGLNKSFDTPITKSDLKTKTPYNTYLIAGLPPTPICMPSQLSIYAALHPANTNYFYYVATGTGGHYFSQTYAEHEKQVAVYKSVITDNEVTNAKTLIHHP